MFSRGKRSLSLDLKTDSGRERAVELARRADVLVENFRPVAVLHARRVVADRWSDRYLPE